MHEDHAGRTHSLTAKSVLNLSENKRLGTAGESERAER